MSFIEDYKRLLQKTPKLCLTQWECENSDYTIYQNHSKNCFLCRGSGWMQDSFYCYWVYHAQDAVDCAYCEKIELCYECLDCARCYNCNFCQDCKDGSDMTLCFDCFGCKNCFGCSGLSKKEYCIFNEQKTQEEYKAAIARFLEKFKESSKWPADVISAYENKKLKVPHRDYILKSERCIGNHIENCKNCFYCFDAVRSRDCAYNFNAYENVDSLDCSFTKAELGYESMGGGWNFNCDFCLFCSNCSDSRFCFNCRDCKHCFGCDALKHKEFYILNKQFPKENYFKEVERIWNELKASAIPGNLMSIFEDPEFQGIG